MVTNNKGIVLVFVALFLLLLMLVAGLVIDSGMLIYMRSRGQTRIDAIALATGVALMKKTASERQATATQLAEEFAVKNSLTPSDPNPENTLLPVHYELETNTIADLAGDWSPGIRGEQCNAIQVTTSFTAPAFFSGIRAFFGGTEESPANTQVSATSYLPCPGAVIPNGSQVLAPIALRSCRWNYPNDCIFNRRFYQSISQGDAELTKVFANIAAPHCGTPTTDMVKVGDTIPIHASAPDCLADLRARYQGCTQTRCEQGDAFCIAIVPVIGCGSNDVVGFAAICFTGFDTATTPQYVEGKLACGETADYSSGPGQCFGTVASNPILVR